MKSFFSIIAGIILILLGACTSTAVLLPESSPAVHPDTEEDKATEHDQLGKEEQSILRETEADTLTEDQKILNRLASFAPFSETREITLRIFPQDAQVFEESQGKLTILSPLSRKKDLAVYQSKATALALRAEGYGTRILNISPDGAGEAKLEKQQDFLQHIGTLSTGKQPKSLRFSPDGEYFFVTHLNETTAVSQYRSNPLEWVRNLEIDDAQMASKKGFVESLILKNRNELWVSQMSTDSVHIFDMESGNYLYRIAISGNWPKVLAASADESEVYVSCWLSNSVSVIDTESRKETGKFATGPNPRGLALSADGTEILVSRFGDSAVDRINVKSGERQELHDAAPERKIAMRHIVHDSRRNEYYISAMGANRIYRLSEDGEWRGFWEVGSNPNTCALSPDGRWLAVSCRGSNNPDSGYLTKGYEFGKIYLIDLEAGEVATWIWGKDQPTGLDISPAGDFIAFTNFLSHDVELYQLRRLFQNSEFGPPQARLVACGSLERKSSSSSQSYMSILSTPDNVSTRFKGAF